MPVNMNAPLAWKQADAASMVMLSELQANILRGHVRDHLSVLFFRFGNKADGRTFLESLTPLVKSALQQLQEIERFDSLGVPGSVYVGVGLTRKGYQKLGIANAPADSSFAAGMKAKRTALKDPLPAGWDSAYQGEIHAVVLVGDAEDRAHAVAATRLQVLAVKPASVTLLGEETGRSQRRTISDGSKAGIEHFGYVDGRSQPLFLKEQITGEAKTKWDPAFPLSQVITPDTAAPNPPGGPANALLFGSYFVFRKLEQNVRKFKQAEEDLATALGLAGADRERAGAIVVGRFEDGTPVTMQGTDGIAPVANDFTYKVTDTAGNRCPFFGHIRKTNPRGTGGAEPEAQERMHLMARRGQTYGIRTDDPAADLPISSRPTGGVGLLFMAFNTQLANQFEFTQSTWANNPGFPLGHGTPGLDDVIGQGTRAAQSYPTSWNAVARASGSFAQAVTLKGGEYFFMPSLAFLRML